MRQTFPQVPTKRWRLPDHGCHPPPAIPSSTMIQCYWCISNTCSSFPEAFATKEKAFTHQCKEMLTVFSAVWISTSLYRYLPLFKRFKAVIKCKLNTQKIPVRRKRFVYGDDACVSILSVNQHVWQSPSGGGLSFPLSFLLVFLLILVYHPICSTVSHP